MERWSGSMLSRRDVRGVDRAVGQVVSATDVERVRLRAISTATEAAMMEVVQLTRLRNELEQLAPDAAEALAFIANNATRHIARSLNDFSGDIG
jgi:hypothetical protein